jgi:hypothetical protein
MLGIGFGLMLSPITAAVLDATPPNRAGLASSVVGASRQIGSVFGVALLGALVVGQFADRLMSGFAALGFPSNLSRNIANTVASSGASAGAHMAPLLRHSPVHVTPTAVHDAIGQAFTQALHPGFVVSGLALLVVALLSATWLGRSTQALRSPQMDKPTALAKGMASVSTEMG